MQTAAILCKQLCDAISVDLKIRSTKGITLVTTQAILLVAYLFHVSLVPLSQSKAMRYADLGIAILGAGVILSAILTLKSSLTPFPSPKRGGLIITSFIGDYRVEET